MRVCRPYVQLDPAVIEQARQMDLLSYLQRYEPSNLKRVSGNVYAIAQCYKMAQMSPMCYAIIHTDGHLQAAAIRQSWRLL